MSEDEKVTRDILLRRGPDASFRSWTPRISGAASLLPIQLVEMGLPVPLALNMYDEAGESAGITINDEALATRSGLNFVPTIATQRWNMDKLDDAFLDDTPVLSDMRYPQVIEDGIKALETIMPKARISADRLAIMLLSGDTTLDGLLKRSLSDLRDRKDRRGEVTGSGEILRAARLRY